MGHLNKHTKTFLVGLLLLAYLVVLLKIFVFKDLSLNIFSVAYRFPMLWKVDNNYVPLTTIIPYLMGQPTGMTAMRNLLGNIIPFMPLGFLLPLLFRSISWKSILCIAMMIPVCIEILQIILRTGIFDIDDILLNALGIMLGYLVFLYFAKKVRLGFMESGRF